MKTCSSGMHSFEKAPGSLDRMFGFGQQVKTSYLHIHLRSPVSISTAKEVLGISDTDIELIEITMPSRGTREFLLRPNHALEAVGLIKRLYANNPEFRHHTFYVYYNSRAQMFD